MNLAWIIFVLIAIGQVKTDPVTENDREVVNITNIDILIQSLESQKWNSDETPCFNTMMKTLTHAKNFTLWAVWILDSIQLPIGQLYGAGVHIGNYDECLFPDKRMDVNEDMPQFKYCVNNLTLTEKLDEESYSRDPDVTADLYLNKRTKFRRSLTKALWGLCVPSACEPHSVSKIARAFLQISHLSPMDDTTRIEVAYCKTGKPEEYSLGFYIFVLSVTAFSILTISFSYYYSTGRSSSDTFVGELARSFCLTRNMKELTKLRDDEIYSMNLMRIISSFLIVAGHVIIVNSLHSTVNLLDSEEMAYKTSDFMIHLDLTTDSFFTISGLLFMRGMFTDKWKSPLKYMWKRYIRLMIALGFVTAYLALAFQYGIDGPLYDTIPREEIEACQTNWWHSILMIHNVVDARNMCNLVSWYVPCDFQLSIVAAILFCIYQKNKSLGITFLSATFTVGTVLSGLANYWYKFRPNPMDGFETYPRHSKEFTDNFIKPYTHASPFLIGAVIGYIIYTYKPKDYRKRISKFWSYVAVAIALLVMRLCLYGGYYYFFVSTVPSAQSGVYAAFNRAVWSTAICTIIVVCEYGDITILQKSFEWFPLVPISRLSYTAFLLQLPIELYYMGTLRTLVQNDYYQLTILSIGFSIMCYVGSFFVWLLVEAPLININNMLTYKTWKNVREKSVTSSDKQD
ncbi:O-acyltransferase like protein [Amyelois transitella]|uniref:O-acyltransferase like protein n=1 Tax=Amyelois transitella TaxID=680683 RepID=UPI00067D81C1|nr:O-acyltransferase like protein [Amyelois transitella]